MKKNEFDGFKKASKDMEIEEQIENHCEDFSIDPLNALKLFPVLARRMWLKRFIAHYEIFKMTMDVPGDIVELGVFRGLGLFTWANFLEIHAIGDRTKTVYGFDNWEGFSGFSKEDGNQEERIQKIEGGFSPEQYYNELKKALAIFDNDRFVPWKPRIKLIEGDIEETVKTMVEEKPGIRFSMIHFDCDLYRPTKAALESFWSRLSRGGVMLFDEYACVDWPGETIAVDEFFADKPHVKVKKFPWINFPAGYIVKEY